VVVQRAGDPGADGPADDRRQAERPEDGPVVISRPRRGPRSAETKKPNENAPAVRPRGQLNSSRIGGKRSENAVRALTPMPMVTKATATTDQP
jgi:hypothetical protein